MYNAEVLKNACYETIFTHAQHFLKLSEFKELPGRVANEMLRFFAQRKEEHMPDITCKDLPVVGDPKDPPQRKKVSVQPPTAPPQPDQAAAALPPPAAIPEHSAPPQGDPSPAQVSTDARRTGTKRARRNNT
jgi:hypothetical protein